MVAKKKVAKEKVPAKKKAVKKKATKRVPAKKAAAKKKAAKKASIKKAETRLTKAGPMDIAPERKGAESLTARAEELFKLDIVSVDWSDIDVWEVFARVLYHNAGNVTKTCGMLGLRHENYYRTLARYPEFAELIKRTRDQAVDVLEAAAIERAVEGVDKGVWYKGERVGTEKHHSDKLLIHMMKANSERHRTNITQHQGPGGGPVQTEIQITIPDNNRDNEIVEARVIDRKDDK